MSYNVSVEADGCHAAHENSYTSNLAGAWDAAGAPLRDWDGKPVSEIVGALELAARRLWTDADSYRRFEPENGWGSVQGAAQFLRTIYSFCRLHPEGTLRVHR